MINKIATIEDLPRIVEIYNSTIESKIVTADLEKISVEERIQWFVQHDPTKRPLWIFREDAEKEILGWLSFQSFYGRKAYDATVEVSIYLDPIYRKKGLGSEILQFAIDVAPRYNIENFVAFIFSHNIPSIQLFKKLGFAEWGLLPHIAELDGQKRSLMILGIHIG